MSEVAMVRKEGAGFGGILLAFLTGALAGSVAAMLLAPRSGPETRRKIAELAETGKEKANRVPVAVREARNAAVTAFAEAMKEPS